MSTIETRRDFLARAAHASLILGLRDLFAQESRPLVGNQAFDAALARMAKESKPGVVIRIPKDPSKRAALGKRLVDIVDGPGVDPNHLAWRRLALTADDFALHELFLEAVFVCVEERRIGRLIGGVKPNETLILINAHGQRIDGAAVDDDDLAHTDVLASEIARLVHGAKNERLRARAEECQRSSAKGTLQMFDGFLVSTPLPERFDRSFLTCVDGVRGAACAAHHDPKARTSTLDRRWRLVQLADPQRTTEDAEAVVAAAASRIPLLIQWRVESPSPEHAARLRCLLETLFQLAAESDDSQLLPFGVVVRGMRDFSIGCGVVSGSGTTGPCGTGYFGPLSREFTGYLAE